MDLTVFLGAGIAAELVLSLVKLGYSRRGLICWTVAAVVLLMCCGVYFSKGGEFQVDLWAALRCALGALGVVGAAILLELVSPSRRRRREKPQPQEASGERPLNLVLALAAGILCGAAFLLFPAGECDVAAVLLLFPAAAALRQTSYFLRRERLDEELKNSPENTRRRLEKRISGESFRL